MPALTHSWTESLNNQIQLSPSTVATVCSNVMYQWINFLLTNGYTFVAGSGKNGGGTLTYSAASNPILSAADLTWSNGVARSWVLMKSPIGTIAGLDGSWTGEQSRVWLLIDHHNQASNETFAKFYLFNAAPSLTGCSTSVVPTASTMLQNLSVNSGNAWIDSTSMTLANQKFYVHAEISNGEVVSGVTKGKGGFNLMVTRGGFNTTPIARLTIHNGTKIEKYGANDYPYPIGFSCSNTSGGFTQDFQQFSGVAGVQFNVLGWTYDGVATVLSCKALAEYSATSASVVGQNVTASGNANNGVPNSEIWFGCKDSGKVIDPIFAWADHRLTGASLAFNTAGETGTVYHYWENRVAFPFSAQLSTQA